MMDDSQYSSRKNGQRSYAGTSYNSSYHYSTRSSLSQYVKETEMQTVLNSSTSENVQSSSDFYAILRHSKDKPKLLYACSGMVQALVEDNLEDNRESETVQLAYQLMINHPLDSDIVQAACEVILHCNEKPQFRGSIEECEVYRPVLAAIKNHKQDPYFLGTAMHALASLAQSALSCKGLRQSQAYLGIMEILELYKYDVTVQTGGLLALSQVLQDDNFAQTNLIQLLKYKVISDVCDIHGDRPELIANACKALRQLSTSEHCRQVLLQTDLYQKTVNMLNRHTHSVDAATGCIGFLEALSISESLEFLGKACQINIFPLVYASLHNHSECEELCIYSLSVIDHLCAHPPLLKHGEIRMESILRFMYTAFQQHGGNIQYQEAFTRCLARLLEVNDGLYMFVEDGNGNVDEGTPQLRIPLLSWVWVVLLSSIHDTQHYKAYQSVSLAIYYLVVDCERLREALLQRGAAEAVFEGLRQFINIAEPRFEKCVQYGCQALVALLMNNPVKVKKFLIQMNAVYDLVDILEHFVTAPHVAAEALGVIACLSDIDKFREDACAQNIHTRILRLMQYRPNNELLIESAVEVLIIFTELQENMHLILNEGMIFKEVIEILDREMGESISCKCLMLIHKLSDEDYLGVNPKDAQRVCWILHRFLKMQETSVVLLIESLVCISNLCRRCPGLIPELLVDCEVDLKLFNLLYSREEMDFAGDQNTQEDALFELAIDNIHLLKLNEKCRQKMLLTAIKHKQIEAINLLIDIGADVNYSEEEDLSDSPIYQSVVTKDRDIVECLLERNITNRNQIKAAFSLARVFQLDEIIGLLLKKLGLDKQRKHLNWGGFDLVEIKPRWIYPSLGIKDTQKRGHQRHKSLEHVADMINRREPIDNSIQDSFQRFVEQSIENPSVRKTSLGIAGLVMSSGVGIVPLFASPVGNVSQSTEDQAHPNTMPSSSESIRLPSRFLKSTDRRRNSSGPSRKPSLPTVISSPLAAVKSNSMPSIVAGFEGSKESSLDIESGNEQAFLSSIPKEMPDDFIDGPGDNEKESEQGLSDDDDDEEEGRERMPERRHCTISFSKTGATHVPFSTLERYKQISVDNNSASSITSLIKLKEIEEQRPEESASLKQLKRIIKYPDVHPLSHGHQRTRLASKAAIKRIKTKTDGSGNVLNSGSLSPFYSSDEHCSSADVDGLSLTLSSSKNVGSEVPKSSQEGGPKSPEGADLVDGPSSAPPPPPPELHVRPEAIAHFDLSSNKLKSLDSLLTPGHTIVRGLKNLLTLDLKQNSLDGLPEALMKELAVLHTLTLSQNVFTCLPYHSCLPLKMTELDISHNLISSFPSKAVSFPNLLVFNLSHNSLSVFPSSISGDQFPSLKILHLESNQICYVEEKNMKLTNLTELSLSKNSIKELPSLFLAGMTSLRVLDVSRNCLELLPGDAAEYMCSLQELKLAHNKLGKNEPEFLSFIRTALVIQYIDATDNQLTSYPPPYMWRSRGLKHLLLGSNKLTSVDLSDCDRYWPSMERLVFADNKLKEIPPEIGKLRTLSCLDISHNKDIRHLPNEMGKLDYLFYLNLKGLKNVDVDATQNARAIVQFLKSKLIQSKPCYTMKMMIVGGAGKGKTTLLNLLVSEQQKSSVKSDSMATLGVNIRKWKYDHRPGIKYTINCWDFAGQEEFYSTHQCFLTPRSLYVLVYSLLKGESELDSMFSWLLNIQARAPGSHVIIVGTHLDMIPEELFISVKKTMRTQVNEMITKPGFPRSVTFAEISCVGKKTGLDALRSKIKEKINDATLRKQKIMGEMVPASYLELSDMLEEESRILSKSKSSYRVINRKQLGDMMAKVGLDKKMDRVELEQAVLFLHECGVLLHYDDLQSNLSDLYFLDPQWLCSIMSKVITIKQLTLISRGILKVQDIPLLLKGSQFPPDLTSEYIRLLEWFDVALQYAPGKILIPSYLPKERPGPITLPTDCKIVRRYSMCFIPPGFWPRLVIRLLSFPRKAILVHEPIKEMYWFCGLYSFWSLQAFFLIEQLQNSKTMFDIIVPNTAEGIRLLCSVVDNIEVLIDEWFPGLRNVSIVPGDAMVTASALCPHCPSLKPHLFPISELQEQSLKGDDIKCPIHNDIVPLNLLAPDIIISDLDPKYHVPRDDIIMDETNPASVLGKGGFGEVHKALYQGRNIAVKIFSPYAAEMHSTTPNQLIRQEVSILSQVDHPNIIRMVGISLRPKPMLLMEYAELGSLNTFSPYRSVSINLKYRIAIQVASATAFLHKNNIIYRDLKPGNILIFSLSFNAKVNAKLSDYGISSFATESGLNQDVGTAGYKAPELLKAKASKMPYDSMVDVYCYGLVMFQVVTNGHSPFEELTPYERDKAVEEGRNIRNVSFYGGPPWPDMHDLIHHCLQYNPKDRPSAQEIFDRLCSPEFISLRDVISIHEGWEILCFTIRNFRSKNMKEGEPTSEVWMASCDLTQRSMLSCVNLSQRNSKPQGRLLPYNSLILCMVSVGSSLVLLGTNSGDIIVCDGFDDKKEHKLAKMRDSILCLSYVRARNDNKPYVFAGLANGSLVAFDQCVLQTPDARPDKIIPLNNGPVRGMKRLHGQIYVISGLEVFVVNLSTLDILKHWTACDDPSRRFLTCIEADDDTVWTAVHNSPKLHVWDSEDGSLLQTINTLDSLKTIYSNELSHRSSSSALHTFQDPIMFRVTAMHLKVSAPSILWVGLATGHILVFDVTSFTPLLAARRHINPVRNIQTIKTSTDARSVNVVLTCGLGFRARPWHQSKEKDALSNYGVLLLWDCSMPHIKNSLDEIIREQLSYR